jgi:hypothetical protein
VPNRRAETAARARELAEAPGVTWEGIAAELGVTTGYVWRLLVDPDGEEVRRTVQAAGERVACRLCGQLRHNLGRHLTCVHGIDSDAYLAEHPGAPLVSDHFRGCMVDARTDRLGRPHWTPKRILAAIRFFVRERGRAPGRSDFRGRPGGTGFLGGYAPARLPHWSTAARFFGTWREAVRLAGAEPADRRGPMPTCRRGHPLEGENVVLHGGRRRCRTCQNRQARERYAQGHGYTRGPYETKEIP